MITHDLRAPVDALNNLTRGDGTADVEKRRDALDQIVASLSSNEIRHLNDRLKTITFNKDICSHLPVELLLHVSEYLHFDDLIVARHVSQAWRDKFTSRDFSMGIIQKQFRTRWEQTDFRNEFAKEELHEWFKEVSMIRYRKHHGHYLSMAVYHYQRDLCPRPVDLDLDHQYHSGRVAFRHPDRIIVQSLKDGCQAKPKSYFNPDRAPMQVGKWFISDQLLITQVHGLKLVAWSLTSEEMHTVQLFGVTKQVSACGNRVGLITEARQVLLWTVGGPIVCIELPKIQDGVHSEWALLDICSHPVSDRFFIFYYASQTEELLVQEFSAGIYVKARHASTAQYSLDTLFHSNLFPLALGTHIVQVADAMSGTCSIGWDTRRRYSPKDIMTFNMYTCEFGTMANPHPDPPPRIKESATSLWVAEPQDLKFEFSLKTAYAERSAGCVFDDDFEVIFGKQGYIVWAFGDSELPIAGSLSDDSLDVAPQDRSSLFSH